MKYKKVSKWISILVFFVVLFSVCCTCKTSQKTVETISQTELLVGVENMPLIHTFSFDWFVANFSTRIEDLGISINGQLRIKNDSVIWITASKLIELVRIKFTQDSLFINLKFQNALFKGTYVDFMSQTGISLNYRTVQSLLIGNDLLSYRFEGEQMQKQNDTIRYAFLSRKSDVMPPIKEFLYVDSQTRKIIYNYIQTQQGEQIEVAYSHFGKVHNQLFPKQLEIQISTKELGGKYIVSYEKIEINQKTTFPFSISKTVKPIKF